MNAIQEFASRAWAALAAGALSLPAMACALIICLHWLRLAGGARGSQDRDARLIDVGIIVAYAMFGYSYLSHTPVA